jgi:hypothetical protein
MRLRGGNHRASVAARTFTIAVLAAAMFAQLLSLSHEATVRHFRCAEHGELTHVAAQVGDTADMPARQAEAALRSHNAETGAAHEHCAVAFTVEGSSCVPGTGAAFGAAPPPPPVRPIRSATASQRCAPVLASAPKTSPPSA